MTIPPLVIKYILDSQHFRPIKWRGLWKKHTHFSTTIFVAYGVLQVLHLHEAFKHQLKVASVIFLQKADYIFFVN